MSYDITFFTWIVFVVLYRKIEEILDLVGSVNGVGKWFISIGLGWHARVTWVCLCIENERGIYNEKGLNYREYVIRVSDSVGDGAE